MQPKKHQRTLLTAPRARKKKLVDPWCKKELCKQHRMIIENGLADYHKRRKHLHRQYIAAYKQLLARHTLELAKLNEHIEEITYNSPQSKGPPQAEVEVGNCPRFNRAARAKYAKNKAELLYRRLFTGISRLDWASKTMKPECGVCWDCQRAALSSDHNQEKQQSWERYARDVRGLYEEFGNVVGLENLPWLPPSRDLEESVEFEGIDHGWKNKPLWKQWPMSFSNGVNKS